MADPVPVDYNPFGADQGQASMPAAASPVPVDYDPFAGGEKDPAAMQRGEYWKGVASNLPSSAAENVGATLHALAPWNWGETAQGIGEVGKGLYSKLKGAIGYQQDPEQKSKDEAVADAIGHKFYGDEFWRTLYNDPFTVLSVGSIPLTAGAGALGAGAEALGEASMLGKAASLASKATGAAATLTDPTQMALGAASGIARGAKGALKGTVALGTGVPVSAYERAFQAGAEADPALRNAFNSFAKGEGDASEFSGAMTKAFENIKDREIKDWANRKQENFNALQQDASLQPMYDSIQSARDKLSKRGQNDVSDAAHQALDYWENQLYNRSTSPAGSDLRKIESLDKLKQDIGVAAQSAGNDRVSNALWELYNGTKKAITDVSPEYANMMDEYRNLQSSLKNYGGLGINKAGANAQLSRTVRQLKTPQGNDLLNSLGKEDPRIPYMAAGAALHDAIATGDVGRMLEGGGGAFHLYNAGTALAMGEPITAFKHIGLLGAQATLQSPRVMGAAAYGAGRLAGSPVGRAVGAGATGAGYAARVASPLEQNIVAAQRSLAPQIPEAAQSFNQTAEYARGGRTGMSAKEKAANLIAMVDRVRKEESKGTEPLLNLDDTTVAKALAMANKTI